ncbi:MAG: UDP-N-acetylmuramoyl-L-alanyl-D-glutamate--2,6-diaminopimelate ligase [Clostridia bacterium]|nr:UDP-N-acetylmuramoyl-L-alanyl-D-glutamate--2,6-diaminopimelate ligase [Clostridia bacterium]
MLLTELLNSIEYTEIINPQNKNIDSIDIVSVCHNSNKAYHSSLFVCISGALSDGHDYALAAYKRMCRFFVAERRPSNLPDDVIIVITPDTRIALAKLSDAFFGHPSKKLNIIGITGTKGKTTSSLLIYNMLNANGIPTGYIGSNGVSFDDYHFNTVNTTPESYDLHYYMHRMLDIGITTLVMEVSSQALKYNRVHGINFDITVFTNLYPDHIGTFEHPDFNDYKSAKRTLFTDYNTKFIVYNADDENARDMIEDLDCEKKGFGIENADADYKASRIAFFRSPGNIGVSFECSAEEKKYPLSLSFPGEFSVYNAMTAIAVCRKFGISFDSIIKTMQKVRIKGRFETMELPNGATVVIDYAHNGVSLKAALSALRVYNPNRLICLFGSVGGRTQIRRAELGLVASKDADFCIITSDNPDNEPPSAIIAEIASYFTAGSCPYVAIPDRKKAIIYALENSDEGDIILLAGKGHETYQLIAGEREHFSEVEIINDYCYSKKKN